VKRFFVLAIAAGGGCIGENAMVFLRQLANTDGAGDLSDSRAFVAYVTDFRSIFEYAKCEVS